VIISYLFDPDGIFQTNIARCSPGQFIAGPHRPDEGDPVHAAKVYLRPLERLAVFDADPVPRISLGTTSSRLRQLSLHPGSGSERKNWPEAKWSELLTYFARSTDYHLLLIGGEAEGERLHRLKSMLNLGHRLTIAQSLPLVELAALMQSSAFFIGHDSGISHLASALGLPGLILWSNTSAEIWRPPGEKMRILAHKKSIEQLTVETVLQAFHLAERETMGFRR